MMGPLTNLGQGWGWTLLPDPVISVWSFLTGPSYLILPPKRRRGPPSYLSLCTMWYDTPPPWTKWQTFVKILSFLAHIFYKMVDLVNRLPIRFNEILRQKNCVIIGIHKYEGYWRVIFCRRDLNWQIGCNLCQIKIKVTRPCGTSFIWILECSSKIGRKYRIIYFFLQQFLVVRCNTKISS